MAPWSPWEPSGLGPSPFAGWPTGRGALAFARLVVVSALRFPASALVFAVDGVAVAVTETGVWLAAPLETVLTRKVVRLDTSRLALSACDAEPSRDGLAKAVASVVVSLLARVASDVSDTSAMRSSDSRRARWFELV